MRQPTGLEARRTSRISLRVDPQVDEDLRYAAALEHKTLTAFMLDAARDRAEQTVSRRRVMELSEADLVRVLDELDRPGEVVEPLVKVAERVMRRIEERTAKRDGHATPLRRHPVCPAETRT